MNEDWIRPPAPPVLAPGEAHVWLAHLPAAHDAREDLHALLLAALAQKDEFLRAARRFEGLERPSNGDVEAFREYEAEIGQMIFSAFDIRGAAPKRQK